MIADSCFPLTLNPKENIEDSASCFVADILYPFLCSLFICKLHKQPYSVRSGELLQISGLYFFRHSVPMCLNLDTEILASSPLPPKTAILEERRE